MTNTRKIIIGNWKMNGNPTHAKNFIQQLQNSIAVDKSNCEVVICPPACLIPIMDKYSHGDIELGGQDCHQQLSGAYTGNISASMLKGCNAKYVILGHSERREQYHETNDMIKAKGNVAHEVGLNIILCIGESLEARQQGEYKNVLKKQLLDSLPLTSNPENTIIAYEPIWAIGSGKAASIDEIREIHQFIKTTIQDWSQSVSNIIDKSFRVVYGGSVKSDNASEMLAINEVNGLLVGGASLDYKDFWPIIQATKPKLKFK